MRPDQLFGSMYGRPLLGLLILLAFTMSACDSAADNNTNNSSPQPTPMSPAMAVAKAEDKFQDSDDFHQTARAEAREAATSYVKAKLPDWTIKGLSSEQFQNHVFWVNVDIQRDKRNSILSLLVRKFFPASGDPYWKAILLRSTPREQQEEMNEEALLKRLAEAEAELEEKGAEADATREP